MAAFLFGALVLGLAGLVFTSQATLGPTLAGLACLSAIVARIAQAESHASAAREHGTAGNQVSVNAHQIRCLACGHISARGPKNCPNCGHEYFTPVRPQAAP